MEQINEAKVYEYMYYDLISNNLIVSLVPSTNPNRANNGCCSRAVERRNVDWYRTLCDLFLDSRGKTIIKRKYIEKLLKRLAAGKESESKYVPYLQDINETIRKDLSISLEDMQFFIECGDLPKSFEDQF